MRLLWVLAALMLPSCWVGKEEVTAWEQTRSEIGTEVEGLLSGAAIAGVGDVNEDGLDDLLIGSAYASHPGEDDRVGAAFLMLGPASGGVTLGDAAAFLYGEEINGRAGAAAAGVGDTDGDGHVDLLIGAPAVGSSTNATGDINGVAYLVLGPVSGEASMEDADLRLNGTRGSEVGWPVAAAGDVDGDELDDLLVGAVPYEESAGVAYVVPGGQSGSVDDEDSFTIWGSDDLGFAWITLDGACDPNADGVADIMVGDYHDSTSGSLAGAVYVLEGPLRTTNYGTQLRDADAVRFGEDSYDRAGEALACAADYDGDGADDLVVGAYNAGFDGVVYILYGNLGGERSLSDADVVLESEGSGMDVYVSFGESVDGAGDVDGDGFADVIIGVPYYSGSRSDEGAAVLIHGPQESGSALDVGTVFTGRNRGDLAGDTVAGLGDLDGDDLSDFAFGAESADLIQIIYGQEDL